MTHHFLTTTTTTTFVFQALIGGKIFFSQQIFWIFGAPASEMHTITEYNSPDLWTFCKSYGGAQKRCEQEFDTKALKETCNEI